MGTRLPLGLFQRLPLRFHNSSVKTEKKTMGQKRHSKMQRKELFSYPKSDLNGWNIIKVLLMVLVHLTMPITTFLKRLSVFKCMEHSSSVYFISVTLRNQTTLN